MKKSRSRIAACYLTALCCVARLLSAAPTDNPVASFYSGATGYPAWTDRIKWGNAIDMKAFTNGANDFEKFERARDQLAGQGGGVLYYPAGTYDFSAMPANGPTGRGLLLKSGVVIRGETPSSDKDGSDGTLALTTLFRFPLQKRGGGDVPKNWNFVGIMPGSGQQLKDVDNVGIVWVKLEGGTVYFGPQMEWGSTYGTAAGWKSPKVVTAWKGRVPDGRHPCDPFCGAAINTSRYLGAGDGRMVMGCMISNGIVLNDIINEGFGESGFFPFKYAGRIGIYGSNVFIANSVVAKPTKNFLYTQTTSEGSKSILFDYSFSNGIDVNKDFANVNSNKKDADGGYWHPGVIVRDNWIYNFGFKGYNVSGTWVTIVKNRNARDVLQPGINIFGLGIGWTLTGDGYKTHGATGSSDAFQSRAFDLAGKALWIHANWFEKTGTVYPSNDGEGILCQASGGTLIYSWAFTRNTGVSCQGNGKGYIGGYDVGHYGCLYAWNTTNGEVGSINNKSSGLWDFSLVQNQSAGEEASAASGQPNDALTACPSGTPATPGGVSAASAGDHVLVSWTDAGDNEVGFRVDRSIAGGSWTPIAYRPRRSQGTTHNSQSWGDYTAPPGKALRYRVAAVNCSDNDGGASAPTAEVVLQSGSTSGAKTPPRLSPAVHQRPAVRLLRGTTVPGQYFTIHGRTLCAARADRTRWGVIIHGRN